MDEFKDTIEEINQISNMYLLSLCEVEGQLKIKICGSKYENCEEELSHEFNFIGIEHIIKGAKNVIEDTSTMYEIVFDSYVAYSARWESYTVWDESEKFTFGKNFRVFSQSKFMDYVENSTFASNVTQYTHYGIYCEWQIIDIASSSKPSISKYRA